MSSLRRFFSLSFFSIAAIVILALAGPAHAKADTYSLMDLHSDQDYFFYGMDDSGNVTLTAPNCGISICYLSYLDGSFTGSSTTAPTFTADNGASCSPSVPAGGFVVHGICNNRRDAFTGFLSSGQVLPSVYAGAGLALFPFGGDGQIYMNSLGDIIFDDTFSESWYEATPNPTPEPASLLLLATGVFGIVAFGIRGRKLRLHNAAMTPR